MPHQQFTPTELRHQHRKLLMWPIILAILFGLTGFGELLEDALRITRNKSHPHNASGQIVLVQIGQRDLKEQGDWPWSRTRQANLISALDTLGAREIHADILYGGPTKPADDKALADAVRRAGNVTLAAQTRVGDQGGKENAGLPIEPLRDFARLASISIEYNWQMAVWHMPSQSVIDGRRLPSMAMALADRLPVDDRPFPIDYSILPDSIPVVDATDVLSGRVARSAIAGKKVVIGTNSFVIGDQYRIPGVGKRGGVYVHILAAETLKKGIPLSLGWFPAFLLALGACVLAATRERARILVGAIGVLLVAPLPLEINLVFVDVTPGIFLVLTVAGKMIWRRMRAGGLINALSGLPNLTALRADKEGRDLPLVAVRVHNYAEIASTLNAEGERTMIDQVVQRLTLGNREKRIYQGDEGIFAWFADKSTPFASHLEALHALFRSPVKVAGTSYDIALSFGVELGSSRSISSRLGSALVAAQEADAESLKWKFHDPVRQQQVPWRLSLLSQLDEAIDNGHVWLAYQPKIDLKTRKTVGVEALARWTHPEKGPISPTEFVTAAEQSDRIGHLTDYVLNHAIGAAAAATRDGFPLEIAVNLSARMLNDRGLPGRVGTLLARHGLKAEQLILELTETAAVDGTVAGIDMLMRLRDLGVRIAIDDYGTGMSTLDYLKKVPASEIKIDQSFIRAMRDNRSDLIMVQSTITLAHSLGRTVVAEGVEDHGSIEQLQAMGCDQVQGFVVGRPMGFDELTRRLRTERRRSAA